MFRRAVLIGPGLNPINTTMISVAFVPIATDLRLTGAAPAREPLWRCSIAV
ncbi:hypothetical protein ACPPVQ_09080 [Diaminobutyricibacter sp. McL0618]|uniref:hypothetical protein n=1 Tax=Leifsonia sp. McL0618 TaxID=3415677 RepID=UPI003CEF6248